MILPDINLLVHAYNQNSPRHRKARAWLEAVLNGDRHVGLAWAVVIGFIRITTNRQILTHPLPVRVACDHVRAWLKQPYVTLLNPGARHPQILFGLLESLGSAGNLTTDAHLAALAIEHQSELQSTDSDLTRFAGLRWTNPVA